MEINMRLIYVDDLHNPSEMNIAEAIQNECDANTQTGITENTADNVSALTRVVGSLIQTLHERGVIDDDFVLNELLQGGYEKKQEA
jgi:hypothetical protein